MNTYRTSLCAPKATVILMTYNQSNFITKSLESCLNQDYSNLELIISDDASQDDTFIKIEKKIKDYKGTHKITLNRNAKNLGIGKHFSYLMDNFANGEIIIMCAGDDISKATRVSRIVEEWIKNKKPSLIAHSIDEIDELGNSIRGARTVQYELQNHEIYSNKEHGINEYLTYRYPVPFVGAAVAYKLKTYRKFGTPKTYPDYEDQLMFFRAMLDKGIYYFPEKLVKYRQHQNNFTFKKNKEAHINKNSIFNCLLNKDRKIDPKYTDCLLSHKSSVQQWFDYIYAMDSNLIKADYKTIELMWRTLEFRHNFISQNTTKEHQKAPKSTNYLKKITAIVIGNKEIADSVLEKISNAFHIKEIIYIENNKSMSKLSNSTDAIIIASKQYYEVKDLIIKKQYKFQNKIIRIPAEIFN